jgi:hypothetical protein
MRTVLLLLVLGLLVAWFFYRKGLDSPKDRQDRRISSVSRGSGAYHAVSIKPGAYACSQANEMAGQRFLATEAPEIPLPDCQSSNCECHFVHHNDRRAGKDRRSPFTSGGLAGATGKYAQERREGKERRDDSEGGDLY